MADPAETPPSEVPEPETVVRKRLSAKAGCAMISVLIMLVFYVVPHSLRNGIEARTMVELVVWLAVFAFFSLPIGHLIDENRE